MAISTYEHGFNNRVSIKNFPIDIAVPADARVLWVNSVTGSDSNKGTERQPFASLNYAFQYLEAVRTAQDKGDVIFVAPSHTETVSAAAGLVLDVAGVTVYFLGEGDEKATISFGTVVGADMDIDADNITLVNPRFVAALDALTGPIDLNAANFTIYNGEYFDGTDIDTTNTIVAVAAATGLRILGWKYTPGNEGGTQKQSNIQLNGVDNAILSNIDITGDFAVGCIENVTDEVLNVRFNYMYLKNSNTGPQPGIFLDANATGWASHVIIRIASGTTYVSNVGKLNWENDCEGFNADGGGGDPIGTAIASGLEGKIDLVQLDVGDPSARTNFQNLEDMIGIPDATNSSLDDIVRTGFDSTALTANEDGSIIERLEQIQEAVNIGSGTSLGANKSLVDALGSNGLAVTDSAVSVLGAIGANNAANAFDSSTVVADRDGSLLERTEYLIGQILPSVGLTYKATCDVGMVASTTAIVSDDMIGFGNDYFNSKYYMQVIKNANSVGAAPETEIRQITDYVSATGTFTTNAFSGNVEASDEILIIHESLVGGTSAIGTLINTINTNVGDLSGYTLTDVATQFGNMPASLATQIGDLTGDTLVSLQAKLGDNTTNFAASIGEPDGVTTESIHGKLGTDTELADRSLYDILNGAGPAAAAAAAAPANNISLYAVASAIHADTNSISGVALPADPVADSLAAFIASGGTALGTELADSKSIVDALGSDGTTLSYGSGALLGAIGTEYVVEKTLTSSAVVQAGVDITGVATGRLMIEEIYINTDATGLANGTNFVIYSDNAAGVSEFFAETVANLGGNKTENYTSGSVTSTPGIVLENGKKLLAKSTVADCTGAGTVTLTFKMRRISAGATVAAA